MATQWTIEQLRSQAPQTIPVSLDGLVVEAKILKHEDQNETTIQVGDDYYGTTWDDILAAMNEGRPLEIISNNVHFQERK